MAEQEIIITIDEDGKIKAETLGIKGEMCLEELKKILENEPFVELQKTDEYYQSPDVKVKENQKIRKK
jgi:hypothetical protein